MAEADAAHLWGPGHGQGQGQGQGSEPGQGTAPDGAHANAEAEAWVPQQPEHPDQLEHRQLQREQVRTASLLWPAREEFADGTGLASPKGLRPGSDGEFAVQRWLGTVERADRFYDEQMLDHLNERMREFVERQEMFFLATSDRDGECDSSFRAGPPGFLRVLDERTLVYPEYRGNGVHASLGNIQENPHLGIMLIDFAKARIGLHINGRATLIEDAEIRAAYPDLPADSAPGRRAQLWVRVQVEEAYIHCAKHIPHLQKAPRRTAREWGTDDYKRKGGDFFGVARGAGDVRETSEASRASGVSEVSEAGGGPNDGDDRRPLTRRQPREHRAAAEIPEPVGLDGRLPYREAGSGARGRDQGRGREREPVSTAAGESGDFRGIPDFPDLSQYGKEPAGEGSHEALPGAEREAPADEPQQQQEWGVPTVPFGFWDPSPRVTDGLSGAIAARTSTARPPAPHPLPDPLTDPFPGPGQFAGTATGAGPESDPDSGAAAVPEPALDPASIPAPDPVPDPVPVPDPDPVPDPVLTPSPPAADWRQQAERALAEAQRRGRSDEPSTFQSWFG